MPHPQAPRPKHPLTSQNTNESSDCPSQPPNRASPDSSSPGDTQQPLSTIPQNPSPKPLRPPPTTTKTRHQQPEPLINPQMPEPMSFDPSILAARSVLHAEQTPVCNNAKS